MSADTPVIVVAFANDPGDYLKMIERESKIIELALRPYDDDHRVTLRKQEKASVGDLFGLFSAYSDRVAIFHYGGHASGAALQLEADGKAQIAHADGLAQLLGRQTSLQLVFLNGCATQGQVELLLACGVRAVIATAVPIDDQMATEFAEQFYLGLAHRQTIGRAFDTACAFIATRYGKKRPVGAFRGMSWKGKEAPQAELAWGLYTQDDAGAVLDWKLPEAPRQQQVIIRAQPRLAATSSLNVRLKTSLLEALVAVDPPFEPSFAKDLAEVRARKDFRERDIPPLIIDVFPTAIGAQLRSLFADDEEDEERLRKLVFTYEITVKLVCFAMLAQLWDLRIAKPHLEITHEERAVLNSFMTLTADSAATFDYVTLIRAIVQVFRHNEVSPFMSECARLDAELTDPASAEAHAFMEAMRAALQRDEPVATSAGEIANLCQQAEDHLATVLADFVFIARYKPTTIKSIEIAKFRNMPEQYIHMQVALDKATSIPEEEPVTYEKFTDSGSVILQKDRQSAADFLNLSPFVVDQNALLGKPLSKLYLLSHHDPEAESHHYTMVDNPTKGMVVSSEEHPRVKAMLEAFKEAVFDR